MTLWSKIVSLFLPAAAPPPEAGTSSIWTIEAVEAAIEAAGREEVFDEARRLGWSAYNAPPLYVWGIIANEVSARKRHTARTVH